MTDFVGFESDTVFTDLVGDHLPRPTNLSPTAFSDLPTPNADTEIETFGLLAFIGGGYVNGPTNEEGVVVNTIDFSGFILRDLQDEWFERIILNPSVLDLGNVLSSQARNVEILNNYRITKQNWAALNDLTGGEVTTSGVPTLPTILNALESVTIQVNISVDGAPTIDGDLEFVFDVATLLLPITGTRVILFPFQPEAPVREVLRFNTDILIHVDGSEQRIQKRKAPRQIFAFQLFMDGDNERDRLNAILYDWQDKVFGIPIWWESRRLTSAITAPTDTIQVNTNYGDFRVGGLAAILNSFGDFEILEILSMTTSQLVFTADVQTSRSVNDVVIMPVRTAHLQKEVGQARYPTGPVKTSMTFITLDNEDIGSTAAFGTYNSKALIDRPNIIRSTVEEGLVKQLDILDSKIAPPHQTSNWVKSRPRQGLGLIGHTLQEVWEIRQLFHALSGRCISFYMGTGKNEIIPTGDMADTATNINFDFLDFVKFYEAVPTAPRGHIQITRVNGNTSQHQITGASVVTPGVEEQITITPPISPALPLAELKSIEFLTLSRLQNDNIEIDHIHPGDSMFKVETVGIPA